MLKFSNAVLVIAVGLTVAACNKDGGSGAGSASSAGPGGKKPNTSLTNAQLQEAYKGINMSDPFEKSLAAVTAKLGKPTKVEGDTSYWYAWKPKEGKVDQD